MGAMTLFRAMAWLGVAVVFWSLNVPWGSSPDVGTGPPVPWHRMVVGAGLLSFLSALALSVSGRRGNPPSWIARGIAGAGAAAVLLIAYRLRAQTGDLIADALEGQGWTWLLAGGGLLASAVVGSLGLKPAPRPEKKTAQKSRKR